MAAYNACGSRVPFVVAIDETDRTRQEYDALGCDLIVAPGYNGGAGKFRHAVKVLGPRAWFGMFPDDGEPMSPHWGEGLADAARGGFVGFANDEFLAPTGFYALPFIPGDIVADIGIVPAPVMHFKTDAFWNQFSRDVSRFCYLEGEICRLSDNIAKAPADNEKIGVRKSFQADDVSRYRAFMASEEYAGMVARWQR